MVVEGEGVVVGVFDIEGGFFEAVGVAVFSAVGFLFCEFVEELAGVVDGAGGFDVAGAGSAGAACSGGFVRRAEVYPCVAVRVFGDVFGFADERP